MAADHRRPDQIIEELKKGEDEVIISSFLKRMIVNGDSWPQYFIEDVDVFNKDPNEEFGAESHYYVIVKPRTGACGKTDGCELGCWRIMARDKLIKSKETGKILGFKKILKFCLKMKPREYKRSWVMEEYRLRNKLNWKQDHVICKIRLLFEAEISSLLVKHFRTTSESLLVNEKLPAYGYPYLSNPQEAADEAYVKKIMRSKGKLWPSFVTNNNVYFLHPTKLVNLLDPMFIDYGACIFANNTCGTTDTWDGGYWTILHPDTQVKSRYGVILGYKKVLKYHETENHRYFCEGEDVKVTWTIEEYRRTPKMMQDKVLCVIKFTEDN